MKARVVIADPPWAYNNRGVSGDVAEQYATMPYSDLAALPLRDWTHEDAVLAMWGTWPKLDEGVALVQAWGFEYVTGFPWIKTIAATIRRGIGFWTQSASEVVLIGRRGEPKRNGERSPVLGLLEGSERQFYAPGGKVHSRKPCGLHEWLEAQFDGPYLELFARRPQPGWTCWGGDLGFRLTPAGAIPAPEWLKPVSQPALFTEATP